MKVSTVEMMENGLSIGHSCIIERKGEKPFGIIEEGRVKTFPTKKEALQFGRDFDASRVN